MPEECQRLLMKTVFGAKRDSDRERRKSPSLFGGSIYPHPPRFSHNFPGLKTRFRELDFANPGATPAIRSNLLKFGAD